jgi:hypothetical protein
MKKVLFAVGLVLVQGAAMNAFAQTDSGKTGAAQAPKVGLVGDVKPAPKAGAMSSEPRSGVKGEAAAANQAGSMPKGGLVGDVKPAPQAGAMPAQPRSEVKGEAAAANQAASGPKGGLVGDVKPAPTK